MKKNSLFLILLLSLVFTFNSAFASLSISPLRFEFEIQEWNSIKETIRVTNRWDTSITLYTTSEDFVAGDDSWTPRFVKPWDNDSRDYSLSNWIKTPQTNITLAPWETREIPFSIEVPERAEPGWHYAALFFSPGTPSGAQVAVVQRLWVLMLVDVPWEVKIEGNLKEFNIWKKEDNIFLKENKFEKFPIYFQTLFENTWNTHLKPTWKITLIDENWEVLKNVWKETISSPAWAYIWERMVDYIPINDTRWNVLPRSERRFESIWQGFWYTVLEEDWTRSVLFRNPEEHYSRQAEEKAKFLMPWQSVNTRTINKQIIAEFELFYEWKDRVWKDFLDSKTFNISYKEDYIGFNYFVIAVLSILILAILIYFIVVAPKTKAKKEEELRKKIMEEMQNNK